MTRLRTMPSGMRMFSTSMMMLVVLVGYIPADAIEDALSYKSLVLGSLSSGQVAQGRVSSSSCHNYFMNVTDMGYNLVVNLNTSSPRLFLLVKASPILRHTLEDEHNYANYYQFKKQGQHHGVVVTSEHLSPGRWYIGLCNNVQDAPFSQDSSRTGARSADPSTEYAEYTFIPILNQSRTNDDCGPDCQNSNNNKATPTPERTTPSRKDGTCAGLSVDVPHTEYDDHATYKSAQVRGGGADLKGGDAASCPPCLTAEPCLCWEQRPVVEKDTKAAQHQAADEDSTALAIALSEARRICVELEYELAEQKAAMKRSQQSMQQEVHSRHENFEELQRMLDAQQCRCIELEGQAEMWRRAAEESEKELKKVQREKFAAEKASEVLEEEVNASRRRLMQLQTQLDTRMSPTRTPNLANLEVGSGGSSPLVADRLFSSTFTFGNPNSTMGTPIGTPLSSPYQVKHKSSHRHTSFEQEMHNTALAAFMRPQNETSFFDFDKDFVPENLEAAPPTHLRPGQDPDSRTAAGSRASDSGQDTRARGRRGGQRRKRAAGEGQHNREDALTDNLATSIALAALGDNDDFNH